MISIYFDKVRAVIAKNRSVEMIGPGPDIAAISAVAAVIDELPHGILIFDDYGSVLAVNHVLSDMCLDVIESFGIHEKLPERVWKALDKTAALPSWVEMLRRQIAIALNPEAHPVDIRNGCDPSDEGWRFEHRRVGDFGHMVSVFEPKTVRPYDCDGVPISSEDSLTGLMNRDGFLGQLEKHTSSRQPCHLLCLDLDGFKLVNDTLGHPTGDKLLAAVGQRIQSVLGDGDIAGRLGGDEFALITVGRSQDAAASFAHHLVELLGRTYLADGQMISVGVSIGIATAPSDALNSKDLLKFADMALYDAKRLGKGMFRCFESSMARKMERQRQLEQEIRRGLALRQFELHYQPQFDLNSGQPVGLEALLRWRHPDRGLLEPSAFVAAAEQSGLIVPLGEWVFRTACRCAVTWPEHLALAVNLSPAQFRQRSLVEFIAMTLDETGLPGTRVEIEITESMLFESSHSEIEALSYLRDLGIRISLDDFGTGYSSLNALHSFPIDKVKIDRSFIERFEDDPRAQVLVNAIASVGRGLSIKTIAEGVETEGQKRAAIAQGCNEFQGFLASEPMPQQTLDDWIQGNFYPPVSNAR